LAEQRRASPRVEISLTCDRISGTAACSVTDNATGIPEHKIPLLFEPYFTTKPSDRGTGLGLFVVQHVTRDAGGEVTVQSVTGEGTTFTITVPSSDEESAEASRTHASFPHERLQ
jgi:signal transduction histidine kinase